MAGKLLLSKNKEWYFNATRFHIWSLATERPPSIVKILITWAHSMIQSLLAGPYSMEMIVTTHLHCTGGSDYCSVKVAASSRTSTSSSKGSQQQLVQYVMITPQEMAPPHRSPRVRFVVEKTKWSSGSVVGLPSLLDLDPPAVSLNPSHFG